MIWTVNLICLVNLVQASLPSLAEIVSRTKWCLGENAHCPVNVYKDLDLCCKPLVCTVVPKTCKPNFFNKYFEISDYKDRRCLYPSIYLSPQKSLKQSASPKFYHSTTLAYEFAALPGNEVMSDNFKNTIIGNSSASDSSAIKTMITITNSNNETENKSEEGYVAPTREKSYRESELDSHTDFTDSSNEIRQLLKRHISNDSNSESSQSLSSMSFQEENNNNLEHPKHSSNTSCGIGDCFESTQTQSNASLEYSDSVSGSRSGEVYDNSEIEVYESSTVNLMSHLKNKFSERNNLTTPSALGVSEEDWHSSDMKLDSRPKIFKIVTVHPWEWFRTNVKAVRLNLSTEISE